MPALPAGIEDAPAPLAGAPPRVRRLILAGAAALAALTTLGTALSPYLLVQHPVLLVALAPDYRHLVLAAAQAPALPLLAAGSARRLLSMLSTYGIAGLYGPAIIRWTERRFPRLGRIVRSCERLATRGGAPLLIAAPLYTFATLAGASGMPIRRFFPAIALGNLLLVAAAIFFGDAVAGWTQILIAWLSDYLLESTLACVLLVLLQQGVSRLRARQRAAGT